MMITQLPPSMKDRIIGCAYGGMIGDAIGRPAEMRTREETKAVNDGLGVTGFMTSIPGKAPNLWVKCEEGIITDDTVLDWAIARALIDFGDYDQVTVARYQIEEMKKYGKKGFGKSTWKGLLEIGKYLDSDGQKGRSPFSPVTKGARKKGIGIGNGIAMKVPLLALFHLARHSGVNPPILWETVNKLSLMTHQDVEAAIAGYALALMIQGLVLQGRILTVDESGILLDRVIYRIEKDCPLQNDGVVTIYSQLLRLRDMIGDTERIYKEIGNDFKAVTSVPYAIGQALSTPDDYLGTILRIVNDGGDADTNAKMAGAFIGTNLGYQGVPEDLRNFRPDYIEAEKIAIALYEMAKRQ